MNENSDFGHGRFLVDPGTRIADVGAGDVVSVAFRAEDQDFPHFLLHLLAVLVLDLEGSHHHGGLVALDLIDLLIADAAPLGQLFPRLGIFNDDGLGEESAGYFFLSALAISISDSLSRLVATMRNSKAPVVRMILRISSASACFSWAVLPLTVGMTISTMSVPRLLTEISFCPPGLTRLLIDDEQRIHLVGPPHGFRFVDLVDQDRSAAQVDAELRRPAADDHHHAGQQRKEDDAELPAVVRRPQGLRQPMADEAGGDHKPDEDGGIDERP